MIPFALVFLLGLLFAWISNELELIPWTRSFASHWTERARQLFPALIARKTNLWLMPAALTLLALNIYPDTSWKTTATGSFLGVLLGNFPMDRTIHPELDFGPWAHLVFSSLLLQFSGLVTFFVAALLMPDHRSWLMIPIMGGFLTVHLLLQFGLAIRLMRSLRLLYPASLRLQSLVDETCLNMGVKVRATWEMAGVHANALAFVAARELAFTQKLLDVCNDNEIKAVCAHELGHLTESRWVVTGRIMGTLALLPLIFFRPVYAEYREGGLAILWIIMMGIWALTRRLAKRMETRADKIARDNVTDTTVYAMALEKIHQANHLPAVLRKNSGRSHPDLYDRMVAAGLVPSYPKPAVPRRFAGTSLAVTVVFVVLVVLSN